MLGDVLGNGSAHVLDYRWELMLLELAWRAISSGYRSDWMLGNVLASVLVHPLDYQWANRSGCWLDWKLVPKSSDGGFMS